MLNDVAKIPMITSDPVKIAMSDTVHLHFMLHLFRTKAANALQSFFKSTPWHSCQDCTWQILAEILKSTKTNNDEL